MLQKRAVDCMEEALRSNNAESTTRVPAIRWPARLLVFLVFHLVHGLLALSARLPSSWAVSFLALLARVWQRPLKPIYRSNLAACFGADPEGARFDEFCRSRAVYFARLGVALGRLGAERRESFCRNSTIAGEAVLQRALAQGRGAIMVGPHYGLWLLGPVILAAHGYRAAVVIKSPPFDYQWRFVQRLARRLGVDLIRQGYDAIPAIRQALRANCVLCIGFDVPIRKGTSARYRFGPTTIRLDHGPAVLALRHRVPILLGMIPAGPTAHFRGEIEAAASAELGPAARSADELMQAWCDQAHEHVMRRPEQWLRWSHDKVFEPDRATLPDEERLAMQPSARPT
jgi:lauroyl/myristoyl acyltransferase